ncbi:sulfatase-like hydrolase/transferase [Labilibaculum euxinus]|uniref:sulfatase-like hydrolase/transferase n=1 Tax=Labilibaculum euxinus TaxID=2686357 RepID=UPI0012E1E561|nr:sulfatase-like hydrolase/transferase [Labilibaculum euxinus]
MKEKILLISKDTLRTAALGCYGSELWKTKNIDELADKGTIFHRHYTAAATSAMSYSSMFTGKYCHELDRKEFTEVEVFKGESLFRILESKGYACHIFWGESWFQNVVPYTKIYGEKTNFHNLDIEQKVGSERIKRIDEEAVIQETLSKIVDGVLEIIETKVFIWVHFPHVLYGKTCYDSDIEVFDEFVGEMRKHFSDDSIYITSDHGHMNMSKGVPVYGFHLYEGAVKVPLITPRIDGNKTIEFPTSHIQLMDIILEGKIIHNDHVFVDTQYFLQENRKLAVVKDNFKYIFNKRGKKEELYDLEVDPGENVNLLQRQVEEKGRGKLYWLDEIYYYKKWDVVHSVYRDLKAEKDKVWREGSFIDELLYKINFKRKYLINKFRNKRYLIKEKGILDSNPFVINYKR